MTLREFLPLSDREKIALLYKHGIYVGKQKCGNTTVLLYQIEGFYAELYYRHYRRVVERIGCFADTSRLDPYLAAIDVEHLV